MVNDKITWLKNRPIAHRGLWGNDIIENSLLAYQNAVNNGYPIEIDIYGTKDGEIVVFHDANTLRLTGLNANIYDLDIEQIKSLNLANSTEKIPTLKELLSFIDGKIPLLIEFKNQPNLSHVDKAVDLLKDYSGDFAIQSFNPLILLRIKKLAPTFTLGVLTTSTFEDPLPFFKKFVVKHMLLNRKIKPAFISYDKDMLFKRKKKNKKVITLAWTITNKQEYLKVKDVCDNVIFENFIP